MNTLEVQKFCFYQVIWLLLLLVFYYYFIIIIIIIINIF